MSMRMFRFVLTAFLCGTAIAETQPAEVAQLQRLAFLVGDWRATGRTYPEKYGDRAGPTTGSARYRWANRDTWLLSEVSLDSGFPYGVIVLVAIDRATLAYRAYAMTNFSSNAVAYIGHWQSDTTLIFDGALDTTGARRQRVTYEKLADGQVGFRVEESHDGGESYIPDSELLLERQGIVDSGPPRSTMDQEKG